jgi:hypothetical protein
MTKVHSVRQFGDSDKKCKSKICFGVAFSFFSKEIDDEPHICWLLTHFVESNKLTVLFLELSSKLINLKEH